MSKAWSRGSTSSWRRLRRYVLERDQWQCQLRLDVCTAPNPDDLRHQTPHVHHTHGRAITGDDPAHLAATCQPCNLKAGDPTRHPDPPPRPHTRW